MAVRPKTKLIVMQVKVLGAARQVGRSAFMVSQGNTNILLDYGAMTTKEPGFPMHVQPKMRRRPRSQPRAPRPLRLDPGLLPRRRQGEAPRDARDLRALEPAHRGFHQDLGAVPPVRVLDLMAMNKATVNHGYKESFQIKDMTITFYDAGHIPGSCITVVEAGGRGSIYTGDINGAETELLNGSWKDLGEADMVITESTYATAEHPARQEVERGVRDVRERGRREGRRPALARVLGGQGAGARDDASQARLQAHRSGWTGWRSR